MPVYPGAQTSRFHSKFPSRRFKVQMPDSQAI
jgi:hypothetical protein